MYAQVCQSNQQMISVRHSPQPGSAPKDAQDLMGRAVIVAPALQYMKSHSLSAEDVIPANTSA